jgi:hypothetical protein
MYTKLEENDEYFIKTTCNKKDLIAEKAQMPALIIV